jgi:hypothetical protein
MTDQLRSMSLGTANLVLLQAEPIDEAIVGKPRARKRDYGHEYQGNQGWYYELCSPNGL